MDSRQKDIFQAVAAYIPQHIVARRVLHSTLPLVYGLPRQGTLVFVDVSGFTAMSEKLSELGKEGAEELTITLNRYFTRMLDIVWSYRGNQLKFGGDALLLLFFGNQHAARAVRCALKMQEAMRGFKRVPTSKGVFQLQMKIAVNTGTFFEATVGSPGERLYPVFTGKEVNHTAQIEGVAHAGEIFASPDTVQELDGQITL